MKTQLARGCLGMVVALLLSITALAQQPQPSDEILIAQLQSNIERALAPENRPPQNGAPQEVDSYNNMLAGLRRQLQKLLWKKAGRLEFQINNYETPGALPEMLAHAERLKLELRTVNVALDQVERGLAGTIPPSIESPPKPTQPDQPSAPTATDIDKAKFEADVAEITRDDLANAAIPAKVGASVAPRCNDKGGPVSPNASKYEVALCRLASDLTKNSRTIELENDQENVMTILIAKLLKAKTGNGESYSSFVTEAQELRTDQQIGAGPTSNSATAIVSKGGIPYLLSFAVENGAAEESQKDTSITFRLNPAGLINLFNKKGFITGFQETEDDRVMKFLRKTSVGLTFDTSRGTTPGVFTGSRQQLSQVSARVEFMNERDPRHKKYAARWEELVSREGVKLADQTWKTTVALTNWGGINEDITFSDPALQAWLNQANVKVNQVDVSLTGASRINAIAEVLNQQADLVPVKLVPEKVIETLTDFAKESKEYDAAKNKIFDEIAKGRVFTLDYTNKREVTAPDTSNFNFIASTGTEGRVDLTANGSFTFFHKRPAATALVPRPGRFRDFQFAGQVDIPFKINDAQFDFWFSGRYERLLEDAITSAGATMPDTKGDIAIGQLGLNIPIPGLGMKFPVSFTFANRTELIKEKEIRGNFGFTFNWDTLLSKVKPF